MIAVAELSAARKDGFRRLFAAYRQDVSGAVIEAYADGLADVPDVLFGAMVEHAIKAEAFFPSVARLRTHADAVAPPLLALPEIAAPVTVAGLLAGHVAPLPEDDPRSWYACGRCKDSGWASTIGPVPHEYQQLGIPEIETVAHCACWLSNPKLHERRLRMATQATRYSREDRQ